MDAKAPTYPPETAAEREQLLRRLAPDDRATVERILAGKPGITARQVIDGLQSARRALIFARRASALHGSKKGLLRSSMSRAAKPKLKSRRSFRAMVAAQ